MRDVLVSARISPAKKEAGKRVLDSLGASASDLINSAYDYLLAEKKLPMATADPAFSIEGAQAFLAESTLDIDWGGVAPDGDYRSIIRKGKQERYESLA